MWRQIPVVGPYYAPHFSPRQAEEDAEAHGHSPRRAIMAPRPPLATCNMESLYNQPVFLRQTVVDPFTEQPLNPNIPHPNFGGWRQSSVRQSSATDVSMPDYTKSNTRANSLRHVTDPMSVSDKPDRRFESLQMPGAYETICEALLPRVPVNTPQNGEPTTTRPESQTIVTSVAQTPLTSGATFHALVKRTDVIAGRLPNIYQFSKLIGYCR